MVHVIQPDQEIEKKPKKVFDWVRPKVAGKFGLSFNWGQHEIFIGIAVAKIEMETIVRRRNKKVLMKGYSRVIDI